MKLASLHYKLDMGDNVFEFGGEKEIEKEEGARGFCVKLSLLAAANFCSRVQLFRSADWRRLQC